MSHLTRQQPRLLARIGRLRGQIEAIERAVAEGHPCGEVLNLVASVRGAVNGLTAELIEHHLRDHVADPDHDPDPARAQGAAELISVIRTYMK
jgi:DNA-binding FrmR family transcriptional regulator